MAPSLTKNITANWVALVTAGLVGLVTTPVMIRYLGEQEYGVLSIVVALVSQSMLLDLGVRNAVLKYVSDHSAKNDLNSINRVASSAAAILITTAVILSILGMAISPFFTTWVNIPQQLHHVAVLALLIATIDAAVELTSGVAEAALAGRERYELLAYGASIRGVVNAALVIMVVMAGGGIVGILICAALTRLLYRAWLLVRLKKEIPSLRLSRNCVSREGLREVIGYGVWAWVVVLSTRVIYSLDVLVVGYLIGAAEAGIYAVCVMVIDHIRQLAQSATTVLTPRMSALGSGAHQEHGAAETLLISSVKYLQALAVITVIPTIATGETFLRFFAGEAYTQGFLPLVALVAPFLICLPGYLFTSYLYAVSKHRITAILLSIEATCNVTLSFALGTRFGMVGVALGTLIPAIVFRGVCLPIVGLRITRIPIRRYLYELLVRPLFLAGGVMAGLGVGELVWGTSSVSGWLMTNSIALFGFALVAPAVLFSAAEQRKLLNAIKRR